MSCAVAVFPQADVTDADLERAASGRTIAIGAVSSDRHVTQLPLEAYVARVLAGEAEPNAPDGELEALAIAIRTYAIFNAGRHAREGFDLCDTTHCQVLRAATAPTRRAALATAGQILTWQGQPAEIFYSASCGGRSERASDIWPGANLPYLKSVKDDVHDGDVPWTFELTLRDINRVLEQRGFAGTRLKDVRIASHTQSGRVATLHLSGLEPDAIAGDQFRAIVGARELKSTAFTVERHGDRVVFTGRGYGHGVGMCVIGAGRRARRGESVHDILAQYYPGLTVTLLHEVPARPRVDTALARTPAAPAEAPPTVTPAAPVRPTVPAAQRPPVLVTSSIGIVLPDLQEAATRAHQSLSKALGASVAPITIHVHETVESFRAATAKPWWVSASVNGTSIDLAPPALLAQRDGVEATIRDAIAQSIVAGTFSGRPEWVRVGAGRYFSRADTKWRRGSFGEDRKLKCPADAELTLAISASAQREAESRAEACFARAYAAARDWRTVR